MRAIDIIARQQLEDAERCFRRKRITQYQTTVPLETRLRLLKLATPRREPMRGLWRG